MATVKRRNTLTAKKNAMQKTGVAKVYEQFLRAKKGEVAPETLVIYEGLGERIFIPEMVRLTDDDLYCLNADHLRQLLDNYGANHNTGGIAFVHRHLKHFVNWFWKEYDIARPNPMDKVHVKKSTSKPLTGIDWNKINILIETAKAKSTFPERDVAMLMILADTGIRRSSLCGLKMGDIDVDHAQMKVFEKDQDYHVKSFGYATAKAIQKYLNCLDDIKPTDSFWIKLNGCELSDFGVKEALRRLCNLAGIEQQSFHDFRRFYALELYKSTRDIYFVSRALDHKSVEVTKRYLALDLQEDLDEIRSVSPMDKAFRQTGVKVNRSRAYL